MLNSIFDSTNIPVLQEVISFAQSRHDVLAGNVANLDTPGYRVRDLSVETFQQRLKEAIEGRGRSQSSYSSGVMTDSPDEAMRQVRESMKSILFHDDSNVGIEQQITEIAKNQTMHNLAVSIMASQFRLLQAAVSERV